AAPRALRFAHPHRRHARRRGDRHGRDRTRHAAPHAGERAAPGRPGRHPARAFRRLARRSGRGAARPDARRAGEARPPLRAGREPHLRERGGRTHDARRRLRRRPERRVEGAPPGGVLLRAGLLRRGHRPRRAGGGRAVDPGDALRRGARRALRAGHVLVHHGRSRRARPPRTAARAAPRRIPGPGARRHAGARLEPFPRRAAGVRRATRFRRRSPRRRARIGARAPRRQPAGLAMAALSVPAAFADARLRRALIIAAFLGFGCLWGVAVAMAGVAAALICVSLIACVFCLRDFRFGVVLLILIMPISSSFLFPHSMFGVSGLNPLNLLLATTLLSYGLNYAGKGVIRSLGSRPLLFLYLVPILFGAALGVSHVHEIPGIFKDMDWIEYDAAGGYIRDLVLKPVLLILYAMLVGAAVLHSRDTRRFLTPMYISMWVMALLVIVFIAASGVHLSQLAGTYERSFLSPLGMHTNDLGRLYAIAYAL